jgi:hypothetical protein
MEPGLAPEIILYASIKAACVLLLGVYIMLRVKGRPR